MYSKTLWLAGFVIVTAVAIGTAEETTLLSQGPIDVQQLRAQTLENLDLVPPIPADRCDKTNPLWGITFGQIPELLYQHCLELNDRRGLLIVEVYEDSLASEMGLQPNQILLQVGDQLLRQPSEMPRPWSEAPVVLMDCGELYTARVPVLVERRTPREPLMDEVLAPGESNAYAATSSSSSSVADEYQEAISIAQVNGRYTIAVQMPSQTGPQAFRIEGTRVEVERQLKRMPQAVRRAVRSQLPRETVE